MSLGRVLSPMELFVETHVQSQDRQKGVQQLNISWYVCSTILFCMLLCLLNWIWCLLFYFQETYNNRLRERYGDDPLTHPKFDPDLWMEAGLSGGPDKNRVWGSPTLRSKTCGRPVVLQPLGAPNQYRAPNLSSLWPCSNTRLSSPKSTTTYQRRTHNSKNNKEWRMNNSKNNTERSMNNKEQPMNNFV